MIILTVRLKKKKMILKIRIPIREVLLNLVVKQVPEPPLPLLHRLFRSILGEVVVAVVLDHVIKLHVQIKLLRQLPKRFIRLLARKNLIVVPRREVQVRRLE